MGGGLNDCQGKSIEIKGIRINPGDIIFGDLDGVVVILQELENEVFEEAFDKGRTEKLLRKSVDEGMAAVEAYEKFGSPQ